MASYDYPGWAYAGWDPNSAQADWTAKGKNESALQQTRGYGPSASTGSGSTSDPIKIAKDLSAFQAEQNKPLIESYTASKGPLNQRYDSLIAQLKTDQAKSTEMQSNTTRSELGRRGIYSGGVWDQSITDALNYITSSFSNLLSQTESNRGQELSEIDRTVAQLQSGSSSDVISQAMNLYSIQKADELARLETEAKKYTNPLDDALKQSQTAYYAALAAAQGAKTAGGTGGSGSSGSGGYSSEASTLQSIFGFDWGKYGL